MHLQASDLQWAFARPVTGEDTPHAVRGMVHHDDLIAHIEHDALGDLTVCAVGISGDLLDPESRRRFFTHLVEFNVKCEHIAPATATVVIATPPQQRFDGPPCRRSPRNKTRNQGSSAQHQASRDRRKLRSQAIPGDVRSPPGSSGNPASIGVKSRC